MAEDEAIETDSEVYLTVLNKCRRRFVDDLDPDPLLDVFVEENYITNIKERDIRELENTSYRNRKILDIVRSKGLDGYIQFKTYLRTSHQKHLAKHLEATEVKVAGTTIEDPNNVNTTTQSKGYTCSVCDISYTTVELLVQHTKSREHLDVIEKQQKFAKEAVEDSPEDSNDLSDLSNISNDENVCDSIEQVGRCYICDVTFTSLSHANSHLNGKPHRKRKTKFDMGNQPTATQTDSSVGQYEGELDNCPDSSILTTNQTSHSKSNTTLDRNLFCTICNVPFTGIESAKQHYESDKHKKKASLIEREKRGEVLPLQCDICNCEFSGQESAEAHFSSDKHKKKAGTSHMVSSGLSCNICNCPFSGPESATAHYKSEKHKKKELKAKAEELKDSLPKSCEICNCQFSGEDNARQHFEGKKHKKAALRLQGDNNSKDNTSSQVESELALNDFNSTAQSCEDNAAQNDVIAASHIDDNNMPNIDVTDAAEGVNAEHALDESFEDDISEDIERMLLWETEEG